MATMIVKKCTKDVPQPRPISTGNKIQAVTIKRVPSVVAPKRNMMTNFSKNIGCISRMK